MASVDSKHHANTGLSACAVIAPRAARWISSEMPQMQHAARGAAALLEIQQNDWNAGAHAAASGLCFRRQAVMGAPERPLARQLQSPAHALPSRAAADPMRAAPDHTHNNASIWG